MGFKGSKKNTPYAAQMASEECGKVAYDLGLRKVKVFVKGPGAGRESAIRSISNVGIEVTEIIDVTPMPHNGCRHPEEEEFKMIAEFGFSIWDCLNPQSTICNPKY
jgi:small subunit ribosomal protein S11